MLNKYNTGKYNLTLIYIKLQKCYPFIKDWSLYISNHCLTVRTFYLPRW